MMTPSCRAFLDVSLHLWTESSLPRLSPANLPSQFLEALGETSLLVQWSEPCTSSAGVRVCELARKPRSHMPHSVATKKERKFSQGLVLDPLLFLSLLSLKNLLDVHGCHDCLIGDDLNFSLQCRSPRVSHVCVPLSVHRHLLHVPRLPRGHPV